MARRRLNVKDFLEGFDDSNSDQDLHDVEPNSPNLPDLSDAESDIESQTVNDQMMTPNCPKPTERHAAIATPKYPVSRVSTFSPKLKKRKKTTASSVQSKVRKLDKENVNPIDVLDQLETTNALLKTVVKRLEDQDKKISILQDKMCQTGSSNSGTCTPRAKSQKEVPLEIRVSSNNFCEY